MVRGVLRRRACNLAHARPRKWILRRLEIVSADRNGLLAGSRTVERNWRACRRRPKIHYSKPLARSALMPWRGRTIFHCISPLWPVGPASSSGAPIRTNTHGKPLIPSIWYSTWRYVYGTNGNWCINACRQALAIDGNVKAIAAEMQKPGSPLLAVAERNGTMHGNPLSAAWQLVATRARARVGTSAADASSGRDLTHFA